MTKKLNIFFWGTPSLSSPALTALAQDERFTIVGVGVPVDKKVGRKQTLTPCAVKQTALELNLPIFELSSKAELVSVAQQVNFDLGIVIAFGMIFPNEVLEKPKHGIINVHFSLLPQYRGASPVQSALLSGDSISGITWQKMKPALDAGDIIAQKEYNIVEKKTSELFRFWGEETALLLPEIVNQYAIEETIVPQPQNESKATFCTKFTKQDGEVFPETQTAPEIYQKLNAFDIWPGVFISKDVGNIKLIEASLVEKESSTSIPCADNTTLFLQTIQVPGKRAAPALDVLRGNPNIFRR